MIRETARGAALVATGVDLLGALCDWQEGGLHVPLRITALVTAIALVPCGVAFMIAIAEQMRRPGLRLRHTVDTMRLPLIVARGYVGGAVLGGIATLAAMGEGFGLYIFLAGIALIALALSQAEPRRI